MLILVVIAILLHVTSVTGLDFPRANLSSQWSNTEDGVVQSLDYQTNLRVRAVLLKSPSLAGLRYAFGFYRNGTESHSLAIVIVNVNSGGGITSIYDRPPAVWLANRNTSVGENATLTLTADGNLVLADRNVTVWSTDTANRGVVAMELQSSGNLVLVTSREEVVWQSFDHPADVLVLGQVLTLGVNKLISSVSPQDPSPGPFSLEMTNKGLVLSAEGSPIQPYWSVPIDKNTSAEFTPFMLYVNGSMLLFVTKASYDAYRSDNSSDSSSFDGRWPVSTGSAMQYLKLDPDGTLRLYEGVNELFNVLFGDGGRMCGLPASCGRYGYCDTNGECLCTYSNTDSDALVEEVVQRSPQRGCKPVVALNLCNTTSPQEGSYLAEVTSVDYFALTFLSPERAGSSKDECRELCLSNCSCKMAFHRAPKTSSTGGDCYILEDVYSLRNEFFSQNPDVSTVALMKLHQRRPEVNGRDGSKRSRVLMLVLLPLSFTTLTSLTFLVIYKTRLARRRLKEEQVLDTMPGLPRRFLYEELVAATKNFSQKLGQGGFGSVFLGKLSDDTRVAVKRLESAIQGQKEFRTEVLIIGSIHHLHLVQLRGFCAEKDHRLLVYEYVANGSLDWWLFKEDGQVLSWKARVKIALGTARGLAYLHEECRQKIIHLDIKPQNILLDEEFEAKVCDFGMSKLMKREESEVFTVMRGTRGYMAPEWLQASITEKVDVYSFGVMLLELVSGQRCLDSERDESEKRYFPSWAVERAEKGEVAEVIDGKMEDVQLESAMLMVRTALRCIEEDPAKRPSTGSVVQMLENIEAHISEEEHKVLR